MRKESPLFYLRSVSVIFMTIFMLSGCAAIAPRTPGEAAPPDQKVSTRPLDPAQAQRLQRMMMPLVKAMDQPLPPNQVKVTVIQDSRVNAANAGGGNFYVTTGLLEKANDEQLRGILAHELAHADLGHVVEAQALQTGVNVGLIILDQIIPKASAVTPIIADLGVLKPFSRKDEYQADEHGVSILNKAGFNGKQIMAGSLRWLIETEGTSGGFFATHPLTEDRVERIQAMP